MPLECDDCGLMFEVLRDSQQSINYGANHCPACGGNNIKKIEDKRIRYEGHLYAQQKHTGRGYDVKFSTDDNTRSRLMRRLFATEDGSIDVMVEIKEGQ